MTNRHMSPFYDLSFANTNTICECGYVKGPHTFTHNESGYSNHHCRCPICTKARREGERKRRGVAPSSLSNEVDRLTDELDAAELNLHALREENAMLRCRLDELQS